MAGFTLQDLIEFSKSEKTFKHSGSKTMGIHLPIKEMDCYRDELHKENGNVVYKLWNSPICIYDPKENKLTFDDCGFKSQLTKNRMNQIIPCKIGVIYQKNYEWFIRGYKIIGKLVIYLDVE